MGLVGAKNAPSDESVESLGPGGLRTIHGSKKHGVSRGAMRPDALEPTKARSRASSVLDARPWETQKTETMRLIGAPGQETELGVTWLQFLSARFL